MNNELFSQARLAYKSKDYPSALALFTQCLQDESCALAPSETGLIYHQIGNCLVKVKDYTEAIHAYTQALGDNFYDAQATVNYNLGMAYAALHDFEDALKHFEIAISDAKYDSPYKAYIGMGNAYLKLGQSAQAGAAFRSAALDEKNPDPTKALLNLGICFMALDRPQDAVASYESALQFDMPPALRNKLYANLGQAYVAAGQMQKAQAAFEEALSDKSYFLSDSASVDYQRAVAAVSTGTANIAPKGSLSMPMNTQAPAPSANASSEQPSAQPATEVRDFHGPDMSGLDISADGSSVNDNSLQVTTAMDPYYYPDTYVGDTATSDDRFFQASDEELEQWSRGVVKQSRKKRNWGLKILIFLIILVMALFGAGVFVYTQGFGIPSQQEVVEKLFSDPSQARSTVLAPSLDDKRAEAIVNTVKQSNSVSIGSVQNALTTAEVYASISSDANVPVNYKIGLIRDGLGWKVNSVDLYFSSINQS